MDDLLRLSLLTSSSSYTMTVIQFFHEHKIHQHYHKFYNKKYCALRANNKKDVYLLVIASNII